jgi:hypothetical protein
VPQVVDTGDRTLVLGEKGLFELNSAGQLVTVAGGSDAAGEYVEPAIARAGGRLLVGAQRGLFQLDPLGPLRLVYGGEGAAGTHYMPQVLEVAGQILVKAEEVSSKSTLTAISWRCRVETQERSDLSTASWRSISIYSLELPRDYSYLARLAISCRYRLQVCRQATRFWPSYGLAREP